MKIILDVPDTTSCAGIFINYKTAEGIKNNIITTTNALIDAAKYAGVKITERGELFYMSKQERTAKTE